MAASKVLYRDIAQKHLKVLIDDFLLQGEVIFESLQRELQKNAFHLNGETITVTIQRKVYTGGTSKPSPTRRENE